ncbi:hypothetical protein H6F76_24650 [Leptolyngbya sp. FACHB-321]|uniref:hypothetical protein n=1 Tax=Leptolyngbya sp. FACHB-321 TaxID=2692807 RepID=UPI0016826BE0|nr:hypothetical protein [Leptolyngbya sp. FACHB-321]MBD2038147.1 hypothetical protein [Leptolyngbya sp. FACHB-321]
MRLETEFRLCLQRQGLERLWRDAIDRSALPSAALVNQPAIAASVWVKLLQPPSAYSSDEALLLCQTADNQWLAWVPDHGEIVLESEQFEPLFE